MLMMTRLVRPLTLPHLYDLYDCLGKIFFRFYIRKNLRVFVHAHPLSFSYIQTLTLFIYFGLIVDLYAVFSLCFLSSFSLSHYIFILNGLSTFGDTVVKWSFVTCTVFLADDKDLQVQHVVQKPSHLNKTVLLRFIDRNQDIHLTTVLPIDDVAPT